MGMKTQTDAAEVNPSAGLFEELAGTEPSACTAGPSASDKPARRHGTPDRLEPNLAQVEWPASDLESLLAQDHRARPAWECIERRDLSALFDAIKARDAAPERRANDRRILFTLWLYATLDGVGSGREITRLTRKHDAWRWICVGVPVNCHALIDFHSSTGNDKVMDELLSPREAGRGACGTLVVGSRSAGRGLHPPNAGCAVRRAHRPGIPEVDGSADPV